MLDRRYLNQRNLAVFENRKIEASENILLRIERLFVRLPDDIALAEVEFQLYLFHEFSFRHRFDIKILVRFHRFVQLYGNMPDLHPRLRVFALLPVDALHDDLFHAVDLVGRELKSGVIHFGIVARVKFELRPADHLAIPFLRKITRVTFVLNVHGVELADHLQDENELRIGSRGVDVARAKEFCDHERNVHLSTKMHVGHLIFLGIGEDPVAALPAMREYLAQPFGVVFPPIRRQIVPDLVPSDVCAMDMMRILASPTIHARTELEIVHLVPIVKMAVRVHDYILELRRILFVVDTTHHQFFILDLFAKMLLAEIYPVRQFRIPPFDAVIAIDEVAGKAGFVEGFPRALAPDDEADVAAHNVMSLDGWDASMESG